MSMFELLFQRTLQIEGKYKEHESGIVMTDEQLTIMNTALKLNKDKSYRPYCIKDGCELMPRMYLTSNGFSCWCCGNNISFDLKSQKPTPILVSDE